MAREMTYTATEIASIMAVSQRGVNKRAAKENWPHDGNGRQGEVRRYPLPTLPPDVQEALVQGFLASPPDPAAGDSVAAGPNTSRQVPASVPGSYNNKDMQPSIAQITEVLPSLSPSAAERALASIGAGQMTIPVFTVAATETKTSWSAETAIGEQDLLDPRVRKILAVLRDAETVPRSWTQGKRRWVEIVAARNGVSFQAIYRWQKKYAQRGIAGICHRKSSAGQPKAWSEEAIDFWVSLCGKREHRKMKRKDLYGILEIEAERRGWTIGTIESANWWFKKRWNPLLEAMKKGGLLALDNILPPTLRKYSDLAPFEILVGDQHRFDFWVVDEESGEVYRPEGYIWQDLRTRTIYGAAVDRRYDAYLIGLALRIGIRLFGAFDSVYTDNGKPECSRYMTAILANIRSLGMEWKLTDDVMMDLLDVDGEDIDPHLVVPGEHRKAVVKNAKAKMIERTNYAIEQILASRIRIPGSVKRLSDDIHAQDIDHHEAQALAKAGKLLTSREFALAMYRAIDFYNREKSHSGVLREWSWKPRPETATPYDCLRACYDAGWRPRMISAEAADLIFLARDTRTVHAGRILFDNEFYEHDALMECHKEKLDIRYNPMTKDEIHVFRGGRYLCTAVPVEYSSMKDRDLAARKISEKRERRKRFAEEFRRISSLAPDFREYSQVPEAERVAAVIGQDRRRRAIEQKELHRPISQDDLDEGVRQLEELNRIPKKRTDAALPARPTNWTSKAARHDWCLKAHATGQLSDEDRIWMETYERDELTPEQRERWQFEREFNAAMANGG